MVVVLENFNKNNRKKSFKKHLKKWKSIILGSKFNRLWLIRCSGLWNRALGHCYGQDPCATSSVRLLRKSFLSTPFHFFLLKPHGDFMRFGSYFALEQCKLWPRLTVRLLSTLREIIRHGFDLGIYRENLFLLFTKRTFLVMYAVRCVPLLRFAKSSWPASSVLRWRRRRCTGGSTP